MKVLNSLLFNQLGRLRSGWRAAIFLVTFLFVSFALIFASLAVLAQLPIGTSASSFIPITIPFGISAAVAIILGWLYGKLFEGVPFRALGCAFSGHWLQNFAAGSIVGAISLAAAVLVAIVFGGMSITVNRDSAGSAISSTLITTILIFAVGAVSEETLFRGYLLQTLFRAKLIWVGVGLTSLLFAMAHNYNPDAGILSWSNTLLAGVWFAAAYFKTRDLWFPFGIHLMWNWLQGPVFGINVSGIGEFSPDPIFRTADAGPAWLTGGNYGIEGGIACTIALVLSMLLIYFLPFVKPTEELLAMSEPPA